MARSLISRRTLFAVHGWLGVNLGLLLVVICLSGSIATLSHEIDWLLNPVLRVTPGDEPATFGAIHDAVRLAYPEAHVQWMSAPLGARFAAEVVVSTPTHRWRRVYVDPYTARVRGDTSYVNVQRVFRSFHGWLFMPDIGLPLVGFFGFVLTGSVATGLVVYRRFWRRPFSLTLDKGPRALWGSAHRVAALWSLPVMSVVAVTGIWYFADSLLYRAGVPVAPPTPAIPEAKLARYGPEPPRPLPVDRWVAIAREAFPGLEVRRVVPPGTPTDPAYVDGQAAAWLVRDRANRVYLDPYDGEVLGVQRAEHLSALHRWTNTADPLHFGTFGGLVTKLLWALLGLAGSSLILSGSWIWLRRAGPASGPCGRWRLVAWPTACALVLLLPVVYGYREIREYGPRAASAGLGRQAVGQWEVDLVPDGPPAPGRDAAFRLVFDKAAGWAGLKRGYLSIGPESRPAAFDGNPHDFHADVRLPYETAALDARVVLEGWDGRVYEGRWRLEDR